MGTMDAQQVKFELAGKWASVIAALCKVDPSILDGNHHPCPKCGGTKRFNLCREGTGAAYCNDCPNGPEVAGSGIDTIMWLNDWDFPRAMQELENYLNPPVVVSEADRRMRHEVYSKLETIFPLNDQHASDLRRRGLSELEISHRGYWSAPQAAAKELLKHLNDNRPAISKAVPGVMPGGSLTLAAINALMIPVRNADGEIVGIQCRPDKNESKGLKYFWLSSKEHGVSPGSPCHFAMAPAERTCDATIVRLTEGPIKADIATALSGVRTLAIAGVSNWKAGVAGVKSLNPQAVWLAFDSDALLNAGVARAVVEAFDDLTAAGIRVHFEAWDQAHKGIDDALAAGAETTVQTVDATKQTIETLRDVAKGKRKGGLPMEAEDDPHRLARINLEQYEKGFNGRLVFWRDEWWKYKAGCYRKIGASELRAKVTAAIRKEFERCWFERQKQGGDDAKKPVRQVHRSLVTNVVGAMESICSIASSAPMPCWLPDRSQRHYLTVMNGILDLEAVFRDDGTEILKPHTSDWFSPFKLDYSFDLDATCPKWEAFIEFAMEHDLERMAILQEWAGYLLTNVNTYQRFLALEGEGGNGKTVYFAGMTAMLGQHNVSHVALEKFSGQFDLATTIGKAANICGDVGEIDTVAEAEIKQFTGGDVMQFDRKRIDPISIRPTAKLMISFNRRPKFKDRSDGLWRRMILIPFNRKPAEKEIVRGMDTSNWWIEQGETSGILLWAIAGLRRLREQGGFTKSRISAEAIEDYRMTANPALEFLKEFVAEATGARLPKNHMYKLYTHYCKESGHKFPLSQRAFGREVNKHFPSVIDAKIDLGHGRENAYSGIAFTVPSICGMETEGSKVF